MKRIGKDRLFGILLLIGSAVLWYQTTLIRKSRIQGDPGPALWPKILTIIFAICGILLILRKQEGAENQKPFMNREELKRFALLFGAYVVLVGLFWLFGYVVALPVGLFVLSFVFGRKQKMPVWKSLVFAIVVGAMLYLLYVVLMKSSLPKGILRLF